MKVALQRLAGGIPRAAFAALAGLALASCTATTGPQLTSSMPAYGVPAGDQPSSLAETDTSAVASNAAAAPLAGSVASVVQARADTLSAGDTALPEQVAFLPVAKPEDASALDALSSEIKPDDNSPTLGGNETAAASPAVPASPTGQMIENSAPAMSAAQVPAKKGGFFSMFGGRQTTAAPAVVLAKPAVATVSSRSGTQPAMAVASAAPAKPVVNLVASGQRPAVIKASFGDDLPGVRQSALFEITRKSGLDDDSDVDLHEDEAPDTQQIASAGSLARLDPNGLLLQRDTVDVACLKPDLLRMLKTVEHHYGRKLVVTSGYRNPTFNHKVGGARNSMHMYCAAADVQMPGISKWELAAYARSLPGRGGVGTYCHTESIHVDIGPERDWNWRCRRRKA